MSALTNRPIPAHLEELFNHVDDKDRRILYLQGWLQSAGVVVMKHRTDLSTLRTTFYVRSMNAESSTMVKMALAEYYDLAYNVIDVEFFQDANERKMTKGDALYFHGIGVVRDSCNQSRH